MKSHSGSFQLTDTKPYRFFPSMRLVVMILVGFSGFNSNFSWFTLNFSIACMVNATYLEPDSVNDSIYVSCPKHKDSSESYGGNFEWDRSAQSNILAGQAWGATVTSFFLTFFADRYGAKPICITALVLTGAMAFISPAVAHKGWVALFIVRIIQGLGMEVPWPLTFLVASYWYPDTELGFMTGVAISLYSLGSLFSFIIAGAFCGSVGWAATFYLVGVSCIVCAALWTVFYTDDVARNPFITEAEVAYILRKRTFKQGASRGSKKVPWRKFLCSVELWSILLAYQSFFYLTSFYSDFLPTYFKEVLRLGSTTNGGLGALPFVLQIVSRNVAGLVSDRLTKRLGPTASAKICETVAGFGSAAFIFANVAFDCTNAAGAIACMCVAYLFFGFTVGGFLRATVQIAPAYTGVVASLCTSASYLAGIVCAYVTGALTPNGTPGEWHTTFFVVGAFRCFTTVIFLFFGTSKALPWAVVESAPVEETSSRSDDHKKPVKISVLPSCSTEVAW